jgi:hypothetical protein
MARPDPLENIMGMLRKSNSIDPSSSAARKANMKTTRQNLGAAPQATMMPPQAGGMGGQVPPDVMPQQPGIQEGQSPDFHEQPNMMGVVIDALNEAIIALKTEIHRARDPEQKRVLESEAQQIRERVVEMGGEPVWADDSIEEGLAKLRGLGVTGINQMTRSNLAAQAAPAPAPAAQPKAGKGQPEPARPASLAQFGGLQGLLQTTAPKKPATPAAPQGSYYGSWARRRMMQGGVK